MLNFILRYKPENPKVFYKSVSNQLFSDERSKTDISCDKDEVVFSIEAKDIVSLKASFNSIAQMITINEKFSKLTIDTKTLEKD